MVVTQIEAVNKSRCAVSIDGEFAFVLYRGELHKFEIKEGKELSPEAFREIMEELLPKRAKLRSMNLLKSRPYTRHQLEEKLLLGQYPQQVVDEALEYVESFGYVNDAAYAKSYVEDHIEGRSLRRLVEDLRRKGIDRELAEEAIALVQEENGRQDEAVMIGKLLEKKHYDSENTEYKEKLKLQAWLYRKGFTPEGIRKAMNDSTVSE